MVFEMDLTKLRYGTELLKRGFAKMQKGGVVMDVTNVEQAKIAEEAGAVAVMALERVPADIRAEGGVARMADPLMINEIIKTVTIPVMAKCRIGHFAEAQVLSTLGVDMIDESEVLTPADPFAHVIKKNFVIPFVCGCRNLGEASRRIGEGAAMIRTKGEAGTGDVVEAVRHMKTLNSEIAHLIELDDEGVRRFAEEINAPVDVLFEVKSMGRLPVVNFAAGGIATPSDASLMMQLGCDGIFVGSGIFKSSDPPLLAKAIVEATTHFDEAEVVARVSLGLGSAMKGLQATDIPEDERLQYRGW